MRRSGHMEYENLSEVTVKTLKITKIAQKNMKKKEKKKILKKNNFFEKKFYVFFLLISSSLVFFPSK